MNVYIIFSVVFILGFNTGFLMTNLMYFFLKDPKTEKGEKEVGICLIGTTMDIGVLV